MKRIPADIEQLMWAVAEQGDPSAIEDFESRFPDLAPELKKRTRMLSGLRRARLASEINTPPTFRLKQTGRPRPQTRLVWVAGALVLAGIAVASYLVSKPLVTPKPAPHETVAQQQLPPLQQHAPPKAPPKPPPTQPEQPSQPTTQSDDQVLVHIELKQVPLQTAMDAIAKMGHKKLQVAPLTPNNDVDVKYEGVTAMEALQDIGAKYGLTFFDQGDGTILVIPAANQSPAGGAQDSDSRGDKPARRIQ